ncbi:MAG: helix-turn-helix domain-containing protein [Lachnospiraceae bacterium]|nr:helix-turn-helix domain-containing protein [Lachnospiraceae bacterium]
MEYLTTSEIAKIWGITARRVQILCKEGRIEGAINKGIWLIPDTTPKPNDARKGRKKGQHQELNYE